MDQTEKMGGARKSGGRKYGLETMHGIEGTILSGTAYVNELL